MYTHHFRTTNEYGKKQSYFRGGTAFEEIVSLYTFDRELRYRVFAGIEKIEVALRARMGYLLGSCGPEAPMISGCNRPTGRINAVAFVTRSDLRQCQET